MMSSEQNVLLFGVSDDPEAAAGSGGTSRKSTSAEMAYLLNVGGSQVPAANIGVSKVTADGSEKQALVSDRKVIEATATATHGALGMDLHSIRDKQNPCQTSEKDESHVNLDTGNTPTDKRIQYNEVLQKPESAPKKVINIMQLNEEQLLGLLQKYLNSMVAFSNKTRNVHRKLKDTIANSDKVITQLVKVKNARLIKSTSVTSKTSGTQTYIAQQNVDSGNDAIGFQKMEQKTLAEIQLQQQEQQEQTRAQLKEIRQQQRVFQRQIAYNSSITKDLPGIPNRIRTRNNTEENTMTAETSTSNKANEDDFTEVTRKSKGTREKSWTADTQPAINPEGFDSKPNSTGRRSPREAG